MLAIAQLVVASIEGESPGHRKLRRSHLRCAAEQPDEELARELGVLEFVEDARDRHCGARLPRQRSTCGRCRQPIRRT